MKIELRKWITRGVFFSHECENNTIKKTVEEAVKQGVSLAWADLPEANLAGANLAGANLYMANLAGSKCDESQKDNILKAIGLVFHERKEEK